MLKIKDNVDIEVLKDYGYELEREDNEWWYGKYLSDNKTKLFIYPNGEILQGEFILIFGFGLVELDENNIQDLIQAGLVEKLD